MRSGMKANVFIEKNVDLLTDIVNELVDRHHFNISKDDALVLCSVAIYKLDEIDTLTQSIESIKQFLKDLFYKTLLLVSI